jgi:hypothetical protein
MFDRTYFPKWLALAPACATLVFLLVSPLKAQETQSPEDRVRMAFESRLSAVVKAMTASVNAENAELNSRINAMNAANPLEKHHLDSTNVAANVSLLLQFIDYLKHTRQFSDTLSRNYEDSLYILAVQVPPDINAHGIQNMDATFRTDRGAFNVFLDAMTKLYSDVLDVLTYLQRTPYSLANGEFTFMEKKDLSEYNKRMKLVDADSKELKKANDEMRKANAKANQHTKDPKEDLEEN